MKRPIIRRSAVILAMALAAGVILRAHAHVRITTNITWSEDVRPIFQNKCMGCHSPVGIAPAYVNLTTYGAKPGQSGARDWAKAIEEEILTGRMPPWQADPRFEKFSNAHQLTKEETNLIISWIRGGAPQGPRRDLPAPAEFLARDWSLGKPDIEIEMPEDYVIPAGSREASYSFNFKLPETFGKDEKGKDILAKWVSGYEFFPGDPKVVHSIIALAHDPESVKEETIEVEVKKPYDPLAPEEKLEARRTRKMPIGTQFVGQYVRGDFPVLFPADAGRKLRAGSTIEVRVFYRKQGVEGANEEARDRSKLGLYFAKQPVDLLVESNRVSNDNFSVPANASNQEVKAAWTLNESLHLIGLNPHLGVLGKDFEVTATYPDGKSKTLLLVPDYRHKWEASYVFETPVAAPAGTRLDLVAHYDNTPRNKNNPAKELKNVRGEEGAPAQLTTYVDYLLDEHLIVATPTPPPSPPQQASEGTGMVITDQVGRGGILFGDGSAADQKTTGTDVTSIPSIGEAFAPNAGQKEVYW
ncbi:hypothetical protein HYR69_04030, partial [Candidatus Sumerlaeota bacterium]|nr:hypothetical protein [Candidatus Sumerlaeota bacterium]